MRVSGKRRFILPGGWFLLWLPFPHFSTPEARLLLRVGPLRKGCGGFCFQGAELGGASGAPAFSRKLARVGPIVGDTPWTSLAGCLVRFSLLGLICEDLRDVQAFQIPQLQGLQKERRCT